MSITRRQLLQRTACGFGHTAMLALLHEQAEADSSQTAGVPLAAKPPHFAPRAKKIIFLFLHGGVSHVDTFDPKPELDKRHGEPLPFKQQLQFAGQLGNLLRSPWKFQQHGKSGLPVSELFPQIATCIDDVCFVRSMKVEQVDHGGAILQLHTGSAVFPRPSVGAWVVYGLGTENQDLPGFVTISPPSIHGAAQNAASGFLPAAFQATPIGNATASMKNATIRDLSRAEQTGDLQRLQLDLIQKGNRRHRDRVAQDSRLDARIESFELAFRMQASAPDALNLEQETQATHAAYGVDDGPTDNFARQCLLARRLVERGVRFVQCSHTYKWDQHGDLKNGHENNAREVDQPIAALLKDLKQRSLLDDTLVVFATEFGRTPMAQGKDGRDHNPYGFTMWLAGGGVKGGTAYGATDEFGYHAAENVVTMYDLHATMLHLLGLDHERLTYRHAGRDFRLTDVHGRVIDELIA